MLFNIGDRWLYHFVGFNKSVAWAALCLYHNTVVKPQKNWYEKM